MAKRIYTSEEIKEEAKNCKRLGYYLAADMLLQYVAKDEKRNAIINNLKSALDETSTMCCDFAREHNGIGSGNLNNVKDLIERVLKELNGEDVE